MSRLVRLGQFMLSLVLGLVPGLARAEAPNALESLAEAVASHPDDPDLLYALAQQLAAGERNEEAVEKLSLLTARWPEHRPEAPLLLGRLLYELDRPAQAVPALELALALDPASGPAHLFLALALKALGRVDEAEPHFRFAADLSPELRGEAWLLAGLMRLERGDRTGGDELLARAIDDDPHSDSARSARLVLEGAAVRPSRIHLQAYGAVGYDSNVTLDSGDDLTGLASQQSDVRFAWGSGIAVDAVRSERFGLSLAGVYDQSANLDLSEWDMQQVGGTLSSGWQVAERLGLRLDARIAYARLDTDPYLLSGGLLPSLLVPLGPRAGWLRGFGDVDWYEYDEEPFTTALERDGIAFGGGLEHVAPVPGLRNATLSWFGSWQRFESDATRDDLLGFDGDYDHDGFGGGVRMSLSLPWRLSADWGVSYLREDYANLNLIDALTDDGIGTATPSRRRDGVWETRLRIARPLTRFLAVELSAGYLDRHSNVDLYDYDRWVSDLAFRVHTP